MLRDHGTRISQGRFANGRICLLRIMETGIQLLHCRQWGLSFENHGNQGYNWCNANSRVCLLRIMEIRDTIGVMQTVRFVF